MKNPRRARGSYCRYRGVSVSSVRGPLAQHLRDEILLGSLELHLLRDGQSIIADDIDLPRSMNQHGLRLRTESDSHRIRERCGAGQ